VKTQWEKRDCEVQSSTCCTDFSQLLKIDYEETYSLVMNAIMIRYLISLAVFKNLKMHLMDVIAYLYGSFYSDIYMKIPEGFKMPEA